MSGSRRPAAPWPTCGCGVTGGSWRRWTPCACGSTRCPRIRCNDLRLSGHVEPGTYLAVAYGGPALPWTDTAAEQPFHLRSGRPRRWREGLAGRHRRPVRQRGVRPAAGHALAAARAACACRGGAPGRRHRGRIAKASREPSAVLTGPHGVADAAEVRAAAGQAYTLRALNASTAERFARPGPGGSAAATATRAATSCRRRCCCSNPCCRTSRCASSPAPRPGSAPPPPGTRASTCAARAACCSRSPPAAEIAVRQHRRADPPRPQPVRQPARRLLPPGTGAADRCARQPGRRRRPPPPSRRRWRAPLPSDPVIPLGVYTLTPGQYLTLDAGTAPDPTAGLIARRVPVALAEGPVLATIAAGDTLALPVLVARGGTLVVTEQGVGPSRVRPAGQRHRRAHDGGDPGVRPSAHRRHRLAPDRGAAGRHPPSPRAWPGRRRHRRDARLPGPAPRRGAGVRADRAAGRAVPGRDAGAAAHDGAARDAVHPGPRGRGCATAPARTC